MSLPQEVMEHLRDHEEFDGGLLERELDRTAEDLRSSQKELDFDTQDVLYSNLWDSYD